jgi:hypothetical protein
MDLVLILDVITEFFLQETNQVVIQLFAIFGYLIFFWLIAIVLKEFFLEYRQEKYKHNWKWVLLAIDTPALNVQTPKAVEQFFFHLAGALNSPNLGEKFWHGYKQRWFSFEIISIEGYIQFLIRTEETYRDLVEAALYAQYPDIDVTEVEDYVNAAPNKFPDSNYDMWAADFSLAADDAYPIRTYRDFEHAISKDTVLKDPMGAFLESFSRIGAGEQMWFQILVEPISNSWKEHAIAKINEVIGDTTSHAHGGSKIADAITSAPFKFLEQVGDQVFSREASSGHADAHSGPPNNLSYLTPGQSKMVEAMEKKISMLGFKTKMRGMYLGRKEVFRPSRGVNALIGALQQYNIPTANSIVPKFSTGAHYFFGTRRSNTKKTLMMKAYKKRKIGTGASPCVLNVEELATIWHFPMSHVKTPALQKSLAKSAEPPMGLPVESLYRTSPKTSGEDPLTAAPGVDAGQYAPGTKFG